MTITYEGRTITERPELAGRRRFHIATNNGHEFELIGTMYGAPGPIVLRIGAMESFVNAAYRFGDEFNVAYVKRWIDDEVAAERLLVDVAGPMKIVCTTCNAAPGRPCSQATDTGRRNVAWFHAAREDGLTWS